MDPVYIVRPDLTREDLEKALARLHEEEQREEEKAA